MTSEKKVIDIDKFVELKKYKTETNNFIKILKYKKNIESSNNLNKIIRNIEEEDRLVMSILNKLTNENYENLKNEIITKKFSLKIEFIGNKCIREIDNVKLYIKLCEDFKLIKEFVEYITNIINGGINETNCKVIPIILYHLYENNYIENFEEIVLDIVDIFDSYHIDIILTLKDKINKEYFNKLISKRYKEIIENPENKNNLSKLTSRIKFILNDFIKKN